MIPLTGKRRAVHAVKIAPDTPWQGDGRESAAEYAAAHWASAETADRLIGNSIIFRHAMLRFADTLVSAFRLGCPQDIPLSNQSGLHISSFFCWVSPETRGICR
jgi:hypothetical protein